MTDPLDSDSQEREVPGSRENRQCLDNGRAATTERGEMARSSGLPVLLSASWLLLVSVHGSFADMPTGSKHPFGVA